MRQKGKMRLSIVVIGVLLTIVLVAGLELVGAAIPAAFIAGLGTGAIVIYVIITNRVIAREKVVNQILNR